jgi:hypothetical protein
MYHKEDGSYIFFCTGVVSYKMVLL